MRPQQSSLSRFVLAFLTTIFLPLVACGAPPGGFQGGTPWGPAPGDNGGGGGGVASGPECDKSKCGNYCLYANCLFGGTIETCQAVCQSRCGNGYFEDAEIKVMDCVHASNVGWDCEGPKTCCANNFTAQICGE